jgi:hypothetical protein
MFENRVLRRTFGPKGEEVAGEWRRLHNEKLHNCTLHQIFRVVKSRRMRWAGHVARMGEMSNINFWSENLKGMRLLGRPSRRCEDNIRMDLGKIIE